jgi:hypothetical protein
MEQKYYTDNFERYVKEQADDFRMIPSKRVWHSLYNHRHPSNRWPSFLMFLLLTTGVLYIGKENTSLPNTPTNIETSTSYASNTKTKKLKKTKKSFINREENNTLDYLINNDFLFMNDWYEDEVNTISDNTISNNQPTSNVTQEQNIVSNAKNSSTKKDKKMEEAEITDDNTLGESNAELNISSIAIINKADKKEEKSKAKGTPQKNENLTALNNKKKNNEGRTSMEFYATPSVGFRQLNVDNAFNTNGFASTSNNANNTNFLRHKPSLNLEAGFSFAYAATKKISLKAGVQLNLTNYSISGNNLTHSVPTTLAQNYNGTTVYTNTSAFATNDVNAVNKINNTTYQISVPVGAYYKVLAKSKFDLFVGASVQPTFVFGGNPNVISADKQFYVSDPSMLRRWNMNTAAEAYINYKFGKMNLLAGPQVRYQLLSTYKSNIVVSEKLYNLGFKIGLAKNF